MAYRYDNPQYSASLIVQRTPPRLTARTFSCFQVKPEGLTAHCELVYQVDEARTRRLSLLLPSETPEALAIAGVGGLKVKDYFPEPAGKMRRWNVLLEDARRGEVRLAVDFQQPLPSQELKGVHAGRPGRRRGPSVGPGVGRGERRPGCPSEDRRPPRGHRPVGRSNYQPGRRLLGVYEFVGTAPPVEIDTARHRNYPLYSALVERAEFNTLLSADGVSQTQARFLLHTKALYLEVSFPRAANSGRPNCLVPAAPGVTRR